MGPTHAKERSDTERHCLPPSTPHSFPPCFQIEEIRAGATLMRQEIDRWHAILMGWRRLTAKARAQELGIAFPNDEDNDLPDWSNVQTLHQREYRLMREHLAGAEVLRVHEHASYSALLCLWGTVSMEMHVRAQLGADERELWQILAKQRPIIADADPDPDWDPPPAPSPVAEADTEPPPLPPVCPAAAMKRQRHLEAYVRDWMAECEGAHARGTGLRAAHKTSNLLALAGTPPTMLRKSLDASSRREWLRYGAAGPPRPRKGGRGPPEPAAAARLPPLPGVPGAAAEAAALQLRGNLPPATRTKRGRGAKPLSLPPLPPGRGLHSPRPIVAAAASEAADIASEDVRSDAGAASDVEGLAFDDETAALAGGAPAFSNDELATALKAGPVARVLEAVGAKAALPNSPGVDPWTPLTGTLNSRPGD